MLPQSIDARNFHVYLGMPAHTVHDLLGCSPLKVDGLAIPLHYGILRRLHGWYKSKHALIKQNGFLHIGTRQQGRDSFRYRRACDDGTSKRLIPSSVAGGADFAFYGGDPGVRATFGISPAWRIYARQCMCHQRSYKGTVGILRPPKNRGLRMTVGASRGKTARQLSLSLLPRCSNNPSPGPRRLVKAPSRSTLSPRERAVRSRERA